jgi:hypothetical protein
LESEKEEERKVIPRPIENPPKLLSSYRSKSPNRQRSTHKRDMNLNNHSIKHMPEYVVNKVVDLILKEKI